MTCTRCAAGDGTCRETPEPTAHPIKLTGSIPGYGELQANFTITPTEGGVLFGYWYDDPVKHEVGRVFRLSDSEAFWLGEALIKAKGRT